MQGLERKMHFSVAHHKEATPDAVATERIQPRCPRQPRPPSQQRPYNLSLESCATIRVRPRRPCAISSFPINNAALPSNTFLHRSIVGQVVLACVCFCIWPVKPHEDVPCFHGPRHKHKSASQSCCVHPLPNCVVSSKLPCAEKMLVIVAENPSIIPHRQPMAWPVP